MPVSESLYLSKRKTDVYALLAYMTVWQYFSMPRVEGVRLPVIPFNFEWLRFTQYLHIDLGILLDPISVMMLVVITTVSLMVHVYSLGYIHGEKVSSAITPSFPFSASRCWVSW